MNKKQKISAIIGISLALILASGAFCLAQENPTQQTNSTPVESAGTLIGGIASSAINGVFLFVINAVGFIGGTLFSWAGALTNLTLSLNFDILNNPMIGVGWGIARDLTNLGFVLFIIIIAIATILRIQQYEAKSTLGKLIAVALLVNFSLLFAGVFIDFSNMLTNYFIKSITPDNVGIGGLGPSLANAFGIQNLLNVKDATEISEVAQGVAQFGKGSLAVIASGSFVAAFTFLGALSLLALAVMFLVRYVALSILLILVPLAFLFIILPATGKIFSQWLSQFMKWIIFAPTASFFLYLAVYMTVNYGKMMDNLAIQSQGIGTANQMAFQNLIISQPLQTIGRLVIVIGLLLGGLITANSMGIAGSKAFLGIAQATGKGVGGWLGRKGVTGATALTTRSEWGRKGIEAMQKAGLQRGAFGRLVTAPIRTLGTGLSNIGVIQGEKLIKQAEARQKDLSDKQLALRVSGMSRDDQIVALARLAKNRNLDMVPDLKRYIQDARNKQVFAAYGQQKSYDDLEKTAGFSYEMLSGKDRDGKSIGREAAAQKFYSKFGKKDWAKAQFNEIFDGKPQFGFSAKDHQLLQQLATYGISVNNPGDLRKVMVNVKPENFENVKKAIEQAQIAYPSLAQAIEDAKSKTLAARATGELFDTTSYPTT